VACAWLTRVRVPQTDSLKLFPKVDASFKYNVDAVVGNLLPTRYTTCYVTASPTSHERIDKVGSDLIEKQICERLVQIHYERMAKAGIVVNSSVATVVNGRRLARWNAQGDWWKKGMAIWEQFGPWIVVGLGWGIRWRFRQQKK